MGDWGTGRLWGMKRDGSGKWQLQQLLHTKLHFTAGGEDKQGNLYITEAASQYGVWNPFDQARGSVWKVVAETRFRRARRPRRSSSVIASHFVPSVVGLERHR